MEVNEQQQPDQQQVNPGQEGSNNSNENIASGKIDEGEGSDTADTDEDDVKQSGADGPHTEQQNVAAGTQQQS